MPDSSPTLTALRREAVLTRAHLADHVQQLEDQLNVPKRLKNEFTASPLKWTAIGLGAGYMALKALPVLFRLVRKPAGAALVQPLLATAASAAWPMVSRYLHEHFWQRPSQALPLMPADKLPHRRVESL